MAASMRQRTRTLLTTLLVAATAPFSAAGYEIYTWVDENGVVHYSESKPEEIAAPVETMFIEATNPPGYDPDEDYWSITNQAERVNADWTAMQEEKAEERARERTLEIEQRLAEIERELAAEEQAHYDMFRPTYGFFAQRHHRFFNRGFHHRALHDRDRRPPHHSRDRSGPSTSGSRPGWSQPQPPAAPPTPGFSASSNP